MMCPREAPLSLGLGPMSPKTLVAMITSLRVTPRFRNDCPNSRSDWPKE